MGVPFLDLKTQYHQCKDEIDAAVAEAMANTAFIGGPNVSGFEEEFAAFCEAPYCSGVGSGTDALRLALIALGLEEGDEVITVPNTFIATTEAITQAGGRVVFVDVDDETMLMDPAKLEGAITPKTKAIIPVHLTGLPCDMDAILEIAARHGVPVLEDAAQAHGARYRGKRAGTMGVAGCFSFYPGKNLGAFGEGGAVVSGDGKLIETISMLRDHGQRKKYIHEVEGYNGRLDAIQAAVLRIKLRNLEQWNAGRRQVAEWYREALADAPVRLPAEPEGREGVYHLFIIRTDRREALQKALSDKGIGWGMHYPIPLHLQDAYARLNLERGSFPVAEKMADEILSLPMFAELTQSQVSEVAEAIRGAL